MSTDNGKAASTEAIEADIAQTRAELADTVDELAAKLDVKTRAKDGIHSVGEQVSETVGSQVHAVQDLATDEEGRPTKATWGAGGVLAVVGAAAAALFVWRRKR